MAEPSSYLLTKVVVPPVRARIIPRSPLVSRLQSRVPLILLTAGAGYGKTTLLSAWAKECRSPVAWLTLDEAENDPLRFWSHILLSLRMCIPVLEEKGDAPLPKDTAAIPSLLRALLNALSDGDEDLTLVLDDYQVIEEPAIHRSLGFLIMHAPPCLRLILATRIDPPLPLARLRARGQLVEIREEDLRFSADEAAAFLAQTMDLPLLEADVQMLWQRTEGWIAGLQLAALTLRTDPGPRTFAHAFRDSHHFLLDYVQQDILASVPSDLQAFLRRCSILTQMSAPLCAAVTGEKSAASMLLILERANLFVTPLDDERR